MDKKPWDLCERCSHLWYWHRARATGSWCDICHEYCPRLGESMAASLERGNGLYSIF